MACLPHYSVCWCHCWDAWRILILRCCLINCLSFNISNRWFPLWWKAWLLLVSRRLLLFNLMHGLFNLLVVITYLGNISVNWYNSWCYSITSQVKIFSILIVKLESFWTCLQDNRSTSNIAMLACHCSWTVKGVCKEHWVYSLTSTMHSYGFMHFLYLIPDFWILSVYEFLLIM